MFLSDSGPTSRRHIYPSSSLSHDELSLRAPVSAATPHPSTTTMALIHLVFTPWAPVVLLAALALYYLYPYFVTYRALRGIPAPFPAQFSNLWLLLVCRRGRRYLEVDEVHKRLGPVVRIQPNHVSIADDEAIQLIYGHGNGFLKSSFYDAFVSIKRGLFNTRDRAEHTRKRKIVSHTFSPKSISQFEPYIHANLEAFVRHGDRLGQGGAAGLPQVVQLPGLRRHRRPGLRRPLRHARGRRRHRRGARLARQPAHVRPRHRDSQPPRRGLGHAGHPARAQALRQVAARPVF
ncbi:hypothetical protein VTK73DRAFT_5973 [Phialemonium thermophilum]|uniref:Uncharacterized protein n=1 Tax=Phialemonium thermophilum TaxID=223376 RepID=A0ABR3V191_9PEZI